MDETTMNIPDADLKLNQLWLARAMEINTQAQAFLSFADVFAKRHTSHGVMMGKDMLEGTEQERGMGWFLFDDPEHDAFRVQTAYSMSTNQPFPTIATHSIRIGRQDFHVDPGLPAYRALMKRLGIGNRPRVFVAQAMNSPEAMAVFFPTSWTAPRAPGYLEQAHTGEAESMREPIYLLCLYGSRYSERMTYLFHGDPVEWAKNHRRSRRTIDEDVPDFDEVQLEDAPRFEPCDLPLYANQLRRAGRLYGG